MTRGHDIHMRATQAQRDAREERVKALDRAREDSRIEKDAQRAIEDKGLEEAVKDYPTTIKRFGEAAQREVLKGGLKDLNDLIRYGTALRMQKLADERLRGPNSS